MGCLQFVCIINIIKLHFSGLSINIYIFLTNFIVQEIPNLKNLLKGVGVEGGRG